MLRKVVKCLLNNRTFRNKRVYWCLIALACVLMYVFYLRLTKKHIPYGAELRIDCYRIKSKSTLPNFMEISPRKGKSIFFHETSCKHYDNHKIVISARQACAIESASRLNPNTDVYLLIPSPETFKFEGDESDRMLEALMSYDNVRIMHINYEDYVKGTPMEELYRNGTIENSYYPVSHANDILRYLSLWKYGGTYLDLDFIFLRSLENLPPNYAAAENALYVAAGIINFSHIGIGHKFATDCLNFIKNNYNGQRWMSAGPGVITRLAQTVCGTNRTKQMFTKRCGLTVYPWKYFYPLYWTNWPFYFNESATNIFFRIVNKKTYAVHAWNKISSHVKVLKNSNVPYIKLARKYCPKVYNEVDVFF